MLDCLQNISPFLINKGYDLSPAIFVLLVVLVTSTLNLGILSNRALDKIEKLKQIYGNDPEGKVYLLKENKKVEMCLISAFWFGLKKALCLLFLWSLLNKRKITGVENNNKVLNYHRKVSYLEHYRRQLYSLMFLLLVLVILVGIRIIAYSHGFAVPNWFDFVLIYSAVYIIGILWLAIFLQVTYGSVEE